MHSRRAPGPDGSRADAAARRLALIAADLQPGAGPDTEEAWWADHTRLALAPVPEGQAEAAPAGPPELPRPGRHAARRRWRPALVVPRMPGLGPAHVAVVAVVVALGLGVTAWWVARDRPEPIAPVSAEPAAPLVGAGATSASEPAGDPSADPAAAPADVSAGAQATVTVDVAGKVRRPGIVVLDQGARVTDAIEAAGGAKRGVDLTSLNLARVLVDGEQVVVGAPAGAAPAAGASGSSGSSGGSGSAAPGGALVNLNTAAQAELETLPGVGPVTAQAIIAWRQEHGGFTSIDELLEVDGIGEKTLASLTPHVTI